MGFFRHGGPEITLSPKQKNPETKPINQNVLLQFPGCTVYLVDGGEALELAKGKFTIARVLDKSVSIATRIKAGDLQWPLTKDEPVVKLDSLNYLFSLPMMDGGSLSYGVTFSEQYRSSLSSLDSFLSEHLCFSASTTTRTKNIDWKQFAPRIEDYNNALAKAIAQGTGQIVKGIFICSNVYSTQIRRDTSHLYLNYLNTEESWEKQVRNVGEMLLTRAAEEENGFKAREINRNTNDGDTNKSRANQSLKRVRNLSKMTENLSKATLDVVGAATGSVMTPMVNSQAGKKLLASVPGEVLFASLDAVNFRVRCSSTHCLRKRSGNYVSTLKTDKILSAAEVAEKQVLSATSIATTRIVTDRLGENAGEIAEDVLATTGHCTNTAWNLIKIRKAINPASYDSTGILRNAGKAKI
ncbi:hypothetical protein NC651_016402 [Populus alba x Populus x berolinensis]|nr:hypothetical protein NC651_016402 [Populus alba x Populus x berolinensis]